MTCVICTEEDTLGMITTAECNHPFHKSCLKMWNKCCPICRTSLNQTLTKINKRVNITNITLNYIYKNCNIFEGSKYEKDINLFKSDTKTVFIRRQYWGTYFTFDYTWIQPKNLCNPDVAEVKELHGTETIIIPINHSLADFYLDDMILMGKTLVPDERNVTKHKSAKYYQYTEPWSNYVKQYENMMNYLREIRDCLIDEQSITINNHK